MVSSLITLSCSFVLLYNPISHHAIANDCRGPQAKVEEDENTTWAGLPGLNPCVGDVQLSDGSVINYRNTLAQNGVYFTTYAVQVDTLAAVRTSEEEETQLLAYATAENKPQVLTVIAFRNNLRSEARYVRSQSPESGGTGTVEKMAILLQMGELIRSKLDVSLAISLHCYSHAVWFKLQSTAH